MAMTLLVGCRGGKKQEDILKDKVTKVSYSAVRQEKITVNLRYSGTIEQVQTIPLTFQTAGTVEKVLVECGDEVKQKQLLAYLDETDARNMYQIALAKFNQAKDAYDRLKKVHDEGSLPEIKWIEMETNLSQAKSSLDISNSNLDKCKLYAPVSGIVGRRNIEPGMSSLTITSVPLELVDIRKLYVKISVPENEITKMEKGMKAVCKVSALTDLEFEGKITNISPVADIISRTYEAKILIENPGKLLRPGMVCDVSLDKSSERNVILIPYQCVSVDNDNHQFVYVLDTLRKKVSTRIIKTGQYQGKDLEVHSGLTPGELIVSEGKEKLSNNCQIAL